VYLDRKRVRFARGTRGGSYHDRSRIAAQPGQPTGAAVPRERTGEIVDLRVRLHWHAGGPVQLDGRGKVTFGPLESAPAIYRMTLTDGVTAARRRVYIGETQNLRHRLASNYRNPGATQRTSVRIGELLVEHLRAGGEVALSVATEATVTLPDGTEQPLDLGRLAPRLLAENAALVLAQLADDADIVNIERAPAAAVDRDDEREGTA
jgi:hypothetical protein